jgi:hypothetical protein
MKFKILFVALLISSFNVTLSRKIEITRTNGGPNGFNTIKETHEECLGFFDDAKSSLTCADSGSAACEWNIHPATLPKLAGCGGSSAAVIDDAISYAENQILNNILSGTKTDPVSFECGSGQRITTWFGTDINNCKITVDFVQQP